jgi:hypothetical protein
MKTNRLRRRTINLDDETHRRCKLLASGMTLSISGWLRLMVRDIYERQVAIRGQKTWPSSSGASHGIDSSRLLNVAG